MDERWVQRKEKGSFILQRDWIRSIQQRGIVSCKADNVISVGKNTVRGRKDKQGFDKTKLFGRFFFKGE